MAERKGSAKRAAKKLRSKAKRATVASGTISKLLLGNAATVCITLPGGVADLWGTVIPKSTPKERPGGRPSKREG